MPIEVTTVTLPSYWASALVNGDSSGLDTADVVAMNEAIKVLAADGWYVVDVARDKDGDGQEPRFTWNYQLYDRTATASGGEVMDYIAHRVK